MGNAVIHGIVEHLDELSPELDSEVIVDLELRLHLLLHDVKLCPRKREHARHVLPPHLHLHAFEHVRIVGNSTDERSSLTCMHSTSIAPTPPLEMALTKSGKSGKEVPGP